MRKKWFTRDKWPLPCIILLLCAGIFYFGFVDRQDSPPFHFNAAMLKSITFRHGDGGSMEITDREQIRQAIQLLNDFTYDETEEFPPMGGWSYCLDFTVGIKDISIEFGESYIRGRGKDGGSTVYYGPAGHFRVLAELAEEAHANFSPDE